MFSVEDENLEYVIRKERILALRETDEWAEFVERFDAKSDSNLSLLAELFEEKLGDDPSVEDYQRLLRNLLLAGGVVRIGGAQHEFEVVPKTEQVVEPEVPVHRGQQLWSEYRQFAESHSIQECKQRAKVDAGFASFIRKNLEREMNEGGVGDAVENLNARPNEPKTITPELQAFVAEYHRTPNDQVRKLKRADFNPTGYEAYNRNLEAAIAAGLI